MNLADNSHIMSSLIFFEIYFKIFRMLFATIMDGALRVKVKISHQKGVFGTLLNSDHEILSSTHNCMATG